MVVVKESLSRMLGFNNNVRNEQVKDIDINIVKPNPFQPRKYFDVFQLEELAKSIKEYGVIQPIMVRKKDDYFEIIAGERRFRASQKLGNKTIPAIVRKMT
ncbi:MAG: ParB/RepB/Spo0J family partition protein, partial [Clostridia bacterium]|nr:ParB/RepB/Spo0J family partition protein [Clostridia bacterium]MDD4049019.1 ParB/RepB/Spo0J family partition protein [Clostridia bacterium]